MSESIQAQYRILAELRRVDEKVARSQSESGRVPEALAKLDSVLEARKELYTKVKLDSDTDEKKLRSLELDIKDREDKLKKAESKMMEVKTNEEYQAAMKENEGQKKEKATIEEQVIVLLSETEKKKAALKTEEAEFKKFEAEITSERKHLEADRQRFVNQLEEELAKRQKLSVQLDPTLAGLYNRMSRRVNGMAIAIVDNGVCMGCNTRVRPQLYNEILGFKAVHQCPSCGRILLTPSIDSENTDSSVA